ncbi:MAG: hypothetical protein AAF203_02955 [Pseudomonadota bacterium]
MFTDLAVSTVTFCNPNAQSLAVTFDQDGNPSIPVEVVCSENTDIKGPGSITYSGIGGTQAVLDVPAWLLNGVPATCNGASGLNMATYNTVN